MNPDRTLPWDWHPGRVPDNVELAPEAYLETTYSFHLFRSRLEKAVKIGRGASIYLGVMFDVGPEGRVGIGQFTLMNGCRIICDHGIDIGEGCLISWNTVLMDNRRVPASPRARRVLLEAAAGRADRRFTGDIGGGRPIRIGHGVWIGFDVCVLPGVCIGDGSVVGARSVVTEDVPPFSVVAGNPARRIRSMDPVDLRALLPGSP